ncbi:MAG: GNAT family N-acetyltransferase [Lachnospiraceae bacterium]|nr:GNAT family N-acetyltransferase [Lachnospiraceae bacterium]
MHRLYETEEITVFWDSDRCRHAKMCVTGCPEVFEFGRRPWIDLSRGEASKIWQAISRCPSGALSITYNHDVRVELDEENSRSIALLDGEIIGECDYSDQGDSRNIYHTEVMPEYGGKGIAKRLVYKVVEAAERAKKTVIPSCSYAAKLL